MQRLGKAVQVAVGEARVKEKLLALGLEPLGNSPEEFAKFVQNETARVGVLVKARNIKVD